MTITCFIGYEIDPFGKAAFEEYARNWGQAIPRRGADLVGYFAPHEGSATIAYGVYNVENLAAYEAYRVRLAADLRPLLDGIDGFLSIERFQSLADPKRLLSLSFWRDEEAVKAWRNTEEHRQAQMAGRGGVFAGYRLRIAQMVRDYGLNERAEAPRDSRKVHG